MFWFCVFATSQQMHFLKYDVSSQLGLTTNNINDLLIDNKQFIWVGSENGLFKFDEKSFIHIPGTKPNEKILKLNYFDNKLYVLTNLKNIYTIQKNYAQLIFQKNNIKENINIEKINDFIISDSKTFYSIEEKIVEIKNRKIKTYNGIIYGNNTIGLNKNGHWKNSGLNKLDFEILKNETWFNEENCAIKMIESEIGMFFYKKNKSNEIYQLKGKALKKHVLPQIVESLAVDKNNQIWVSYIGNTLYKFDENFPNFSNTDV